MSVRQGVTYEAYYISDEYNLNLAASEQYIAARFVFRKDTLDSDEMKVISVAREPARVLEDSLDTLEHLYFASRRKGKSVAGKYLYFL